MKQFKVMVIGLDGATFDLLRPWAEQGVLPTLQKLLAEGTAGELRSTVPPITAPAWTSFMTGKNPGKHGLYDWIYRHEDSYAVSPVTALQAKEPPFWQLLRDPDQRVCLVNIPMTYPPQPVNGLLLSGMPAPSTRVTISHPADLLADIERQVGEYLLYPDPGQAYSDAGVDAFLERLYRTTEGRLKVMEHLRSREEWSFFMLVFNGTDTVQHAMWKHMSPQHPLHEPGKFSKYGRAIQDYYQFVDQALGEIVASLDQDTVLILMSDHGFGPFHKFIHVNNWLYRQGWLRRKRDFKARVKGALFDLGFTPMNIYDNLMRFGFGRLKREVVRGRGQGLLKTLFLSFEDLDWSRTTAYSLGNVGQIRLNVQGRDPQGCVDPADYETTREQIIQRLKELRDPENGEPVVEQIFRREELYHGKELEQAADILFLPTRLEYFGFGEYEFGSNQLVEGMKRGISGTHRMNGICLLWGEPVKPNGWLEGAQIIDLAPTILHLMGQAPPADMDGRVLTDALTPAYAAMRSDDPSPTAGPAAEPTPDEGLSEEDRDQILSRLRDLGYVG